MMTEDKIEFIVSADEQTAVLVKGKHSFPLRKESNDYCQDCVFVTYEDTYCAIQAGTSFCHRLNRQDGNEIIWKLDL